MSEGRCADRSKGGEGMMVKAHETGVARRHALLRRRRPVPADLKKGGDYENRGDQTIQDVRKLLVCPRTNKDASP